MESFLHFYIYHQAENQEFIRPKIHKTRILPTVGNMTLLPSPGKSGFCRGLMLWLFVGPTGVYLLDFFCSGIQFNLLLSPYPCFISLLYLDLYVLGDDALIS